MTANIGVDLRCKNLRTRGDLRLPALEAEGSMLNINVNHSEGSVTFTALNEGRHLGKILFQRKLAPLGLCSLGNQVVYAEVTA